MFVTQLFINGFELLFTNNWTRETRFLAHLWNQSRRNESKSPLDLFWFAPQFRHAD